MTLVIVIAAWTAGVLLGMHTNPGIAALVLFSFAALALAGLLWTRRLPLLPALLLFVLVIGIIRVELSEQADQLKDLNGQEPVLVQGIVQSDPQVAERGVEFVLSVEVIDFGDGAEDVGGRIKVNARPTAELVRAREAPYFRYGDRLEMEGMLEKPSALGDFDYGAYLANQGISLTMPFPDQLRLLDQGRGNTVLENVYNLRRELSKGLNRAMPEPQASLSQALLLGIRGRLPEDTIEDFRSTGTSHMLAISGLHVGVVLAMSLWAGAWMIGRRRQAYLLLPLSAIWLYALVSGFSDPVERAAIMGSVFLLGVALGRPKSIFPALALAAAVMVGIAPQVLNQVSFQLSFTAMAGIALLVEREPLLWRRLNAFPVPLRVEWMGALIRALVVLVAVQLRALTNQMVKVQEAERLHIARELHDEIGQVLTGLQLTLESGKRLASDGVRSRIDEAQELVNGLIGRIRELALDLRPAMLDDLGLLATLRWYFERYTTQTNVEVQFAPAEPDERFRPEVETAVYRIIQESLTNVARHAGASQASVRLWTDTGTIGVEIKDRGTGFNTAGIPKNGASTGLLGMRERATLLGGHFEVASAPGTGSTVTALLPLGGPRQDQHRGNGSEAGS